MRQILEVIVSPNGATQLQTHGFMGASCRDASRSLEEALGERSAERLTSEFHQPQTQVSGLSQNRH
jgi:hypothetical protein